MRNRQVSGRSRGLLVLAAALLALVLGMESGEVAWAEADTVPTQPRVAGMTQGDFVHRSGSDASGHGWWEYEDDTLQADVTVQLQVKRGETWEDIGAPSVKRLRPGTGGSGRRSNARVPCVDATVMEWRSVVDVDVVGKLDSPGRLITRPQLVRCGA